MDGHKLMNRVLSLITLLVFAVPSFADDNRFAWGGSMMMVGGGLPAGAPAFTEEFFYNVDHASGDDYAYITNRTGSLQGTATLLDYADLSVDPGADSTDGGDGVKINQSFSSNIAFAITAKNIFDSAVGLLSMEYYNAASANANQIFYATVDADNEFYLRVLANNTIQLKIQGQAGVTCTATSTDLVTDSAWNTLQLRWSAADDTCGVKVNAGSWVDVPTAGLVAFAAEPSQFSIGDSSSGVGDRPAYIDAVKIWTTYDGS